jgi:hypothetical protein
LYRSWASRLSRWNALLGVTLAVCGCRGELGGTRGMPRDTQGADAVGAGGGRAASAPESRSWMDEEACPEPSAEPRLVAPPAATTVTSARPRLRWKPAPGAVTEIQVCVDRLCATPYVAFSVDGGGESFPPVNLPPGYWFWRARAIREGVAGEWTATWLFRVRRRSEGYTPAVGTAAEPFADFNGDGFPDVLVGGSIYFGGASGLSTNRVVTVPGGLEPPLVAGSDLNGDGFSDFVAIEHSAGSGGWGDDIGTVVFGAQSMWSASNARITIAQNSPLGVGRPIGVGDIDGDGFGELVAIPRYGGAVIRGCVAAPLPRPAAWLECGSCQMTRVASGDVDGDGRFDLIFHDATAAHLYRGTLDGPLRVASRLERQPNQVLVVDADYDGYSDVIISVNGTSGTEAQLFRGGPAGLSIEAQPLPSLPSSVVVTGDFDGDGYWDAVQGSPSCDHLACSPQTLTLEYGARGIWGTAFERAASVVIRHSFVNVIDLNGDGYDDLVVTAPDRSLTYFAGSPLGLSTTDRVVVRR